MHFFSIDKYAIIFIYVIQSIFVKYFWLQGTYMLLTCTCTSVSLSACRYSASFYNNSFFDVGTRLNHCFITNYSKLLLRLHVHIYIFPYNLDYFRYIISFLSFHCAYCAKCSWLWCCPFAFKGFKESRYHGIHDVIMCWFLRKEKTGWILLF